jgi:hypothetical protein
MGSNLIRSLPEPSHRTRAVPLQYRAAHDSMLDVKALRNPYLVRAYPHRAPIIALQRRAHRPGTNSHFVTISVKGSVLRRSPE